MLTLRQRVNTGRPVNGFILAGGRSTRMGRDKALLDWHGRTLLDHMIHLLSTVSNPVRIVGRKELPDAISGRGPLGGILTALRKSETDAIIVAAVDLPLLTEEFLIDFRCRLEKSKHRVLACRIGFQFPLCLGMRRQMLSDVERRLDSDDLSVHSLIENSDAEIITGVSPAMFQNINTDADYRRALRETLRHP